MQYRPNHKLSLEARYDFGAGWSANVSALTVRGQYYYSRNTPIQKAELGSYSTVNFKLSKRLAASGASVYLGASNLFDRNYSTAYGFPQAGRFIYAGLEYGI